MERLNTNIGAIDAAFQQAPKVLNSLSVNTTAHILISRMVDRIVKVIRLQAVVRWILVSEYVRALLHVGANLTMQSFSSGIRYDLETDVAAALKNTHDSDF